jgi:hypothetical protein
MIRPQIVLAALCFTLAPIAAADRPPDYQADPDISKGGFSLTLAACDDTTSEFTTRQCTLSAPAIGVIEVTSKSPDNCLDVALDSMTKSAGYRFDTEIYKILRIRMRAAQDVSGSLSVQWRTRFDGKTEVGSAAMPHKPGAWTTHSLDFSKVPEWRGELENLRLRLLPDPSNVGKSVLIDRIELMADDANDTAFGLEPVLLNVIQRTKTSSGGYRSEWEDITKHATKEQPVIGELLDGRVYYFAKDAGTDRIAVHRHFNKATGDYLDSVGPPPDGYIEDALIGYIWKRKFQGMSPVLRVVNPTRGLHALVDPTEKLEGYTADETLGYAYARSERPLQEYEADSDKMDDIFYITSGKVRFGVNLDHGAAGWHWYHGDKQMVNIADFGRQMQMSYYFNGMNPSEVGFGRGQVGNPVIHVHQAGNTLVTRTVPIDWNFKNITRIAGSISHPDMLPGITVGKDVTFGILGHPHLAKWTAYLHTPLAIGTSKGGSQLEIMSNHPTADFVYRANVDFDAKGKLIITETKESLKDESDEEKGAFYNYPKSGLGGNISALGPGEGQLAFGLMVGTHSNVKGMDQKVWKYEFAGEKRVGSSRHVNISNTRSLGPNHASPFDGNTTAQRSVMRTPTVAGSNRYTVYIMSGSVAEVKSYMQALYDHRNQLEW